MGSRRHIPGAHRAARLTRAYLGLGSNLGRREELIATGLDAVDRLPATRVVRASRCYRTEPVGMPPGTPHFVNACAELQTDLAPLVLLRELKGIERRFGRTRLRGPGEGYLDRSLDLDLLLWGEFAGELAGPPPLILPHPGIAQRRFVLEPLLEIAPGLLLPGRQLPLSRLASASDHPDKVVCLPIHPCRT